MRPIASICCSPPESLVPWLESRSFRFGNRSKTCPSANPPSRTAGGRNRFSWTLRLAKIPRSSGQNARPSLATRSEESAIVSLPSNRTEPSRRATIPITDLSVVVLPAPLRPRRVTTSPRRTSNWTPCRMCDSPYQACRPLTERSGLSAMFRSQVGLDDVGVLRHRLVVSFGDDLASREHRDAVRELRDHAQVVLDHQHGPVSGDAPDEGRSALDILVGHAGGRLVEQQHFGLQRQRGRDLECALAPVRQLDGNRVLEPREADRVEQLAA